MGVVIEEQHANFFGDGNVQYLFFGGGCKNDA